MTMNTSLNQSTARTLNKLPQITMFFWVMKICATTLGETGGDLLSMTLNVGYAASSLALLSDAKRTKSSGYSVTTMSEIRKRTLPMPKSRSAGLSWWRIRFRGRAMVTTGSSASICG